MRSRMLIFSVKRVVNYTILDLIFFFGDLERRSCLRTDYIFCHTLGYIFIYYYAYFVALHSGKRVSEQTTRLVNANALFVLRIKVFFFLSMKRGLFVALYIIYYYTSQDVIAKCYLFDLKNYSYN